MWKSIYNIFVSSKTQGKKNGVLWVNVPMSCRTRKEKDLIILNLIETLEQSILIN